MANLRSSAALSVRSLALILTGAIVVFDLSLPLGVAGGVPYVVVVLLTLWSPKLTDTYVAATGCSLLTLLGFFLSPLGGVAWKVFVNRSLALFAIWVTALLVTAHLRAEKALRAMEQEQLRLHQEAELNRERLAHAGRLQILGEMAAGIAHEINQPLSAISTYAQAAGRLLRSGKSETREQLEILDKVAVQAQRAGEVIRRIRALAAEGETSRDIVEINDVLGEVLELAVVDARAHEYVLEADLAPSLPSIHADRIQIQQVVLNLVRNAIEAMLDGDGSGEVIQLRSGVDEEGRVEVSVVDRGVGLAKKDEDGVFDPFFSTKQSGLGIGLSICRSIIQAHGGEMGFRRNQGPGMTFFFNLPTAKESTVGAP